MIGLVLILVSCEPELVQSHENFIIQKGQHRAKVRVQSLQSSVLTFDAIFDQSAIYQTQQIENQHDINKLMGFSDCNSLHHENSARFGWRWLDGNLEIHAYAYASGKRVTRFIGNVDIDTSNTYQITMTQDSYIFNLVGFNPVVIKRENHCNRGFYYMLFPYFGGDESAPHDILIQVKFNY